ncbi:hypothetical protein BJ508DRAFT_53026 [Ascobolus immersus RN42]|uniref:Uncharacterized protein n=1 Tax=Ascobolus immersus RN42 TaxID=1160509 RepID=A0A3N4HMK8_ASCIM|nr:hypothetical protein BJ508DRAFT_53026 [Ascobolus immersus RN42]
MVEENTLIATLGFILGFLALLIISRYVFLKRASILSQHLLPTTQTTTPSTTAQNQSQSQSNTRTFIVVDGALPSVYGIDVDWRGARNQPRHGQRRVVVVPAAMRTETTGTTQRQEEEFLPVYEVGPPGYEKVVEETGRPGEGSGDSAVNVNAGSVVRVQEVRRSGEEEMEMVDMAEMMRGRPPTSPTVERTNAAAASAAVVENREERRTETDPAPSSTTTQAEPAIRSQSTSSPTPPTTTLSLRTGDSPQMPTVPEQAVSSPAPPTLALTPPPQPSSPIPDVPPPSYADLDLSSNPYRRRQSDTSSSSRPSVSPNSRASRTDATGPTVPAPAARSSSNTRSTRRGRFGGYFDVSMDANPLNGRNTGGLSL